MNTRDIADICDKADSRRDAYYKVLSSETRDGNFKETLFIFSIIDKVLDAATDYK